MGIKADIQGRSRLLTLAAMIIIIAGLRLGRPLLIPLALAALLSFMLAPLANALEKIRLGRNTAAVVSASLLFLCVAGFSYLAMNQMLSVLQSLPAYKSNIVAKFYSVREASSGQVEKAAESIEEISEEISTSQPADQEKAEAKKDEPEREEVKPYPWPYQVGKRDALADELEKEAADDDPIRVQVVSMPSSLWKTVTSSLGIFAQPIGTAVIVTVMVIFLLACRRDLRRRFVRIVAVSDTHLSTHVVDEIGRKITRYLLAQLTLNVIYAVPTGIALYIVGIPNAALWALLSVFLRFIPYLGPWLAALMPILLSIAVFDGWSRTIILIAIYIGFELISNNLIEPYMFGRSTGITTFGIVIAAFFWAWLWGPIGLLLATPITVCLVVIGKDVPALAMFHDLLAVEPGEKPGIHNAIL